MCTPPAGLTPHGVFRALIEEIAAWEATQPRRPDIRPAEPHEEGGHPQGWRLVALTDASPYPGENLALVYRTDGGWAVLQHAPRSQTLRIYRAATTLCGLFRYMQATAADPMVMAWIRVVVAEMFDPADPAEAAEQVLFALSGRLDVCPTVLATSP